MREHSQHKLKFNPYLEDLYQSDKPLIIYKVDGGYNIYTDFSKKIILTKKNIYKFLNSIEKKKFKKETDLYLGFFGYEILCNLIGTKCSFDFMLAHIVDLDLSFFFDKHFDEDTDSRGSLASCPSVGRSPVS